MAGITVVGLGPGGREFMTRAAEKAIEKADVLVGGRRHLQIYDNRPVERYSITAEIDPLMEIIKEKVAAGKQVVILASGDPGFYGILSTLKRRLPGIQPEVIPGISSFQLACARIGITWDDAHLTSCHGRDPSELAAAVKNCRKVVTLTDPRHNPPALARALLASGTGNRRVFVACDLSYPEETVRETSLEKLAASNEWLSTNCVMVIINDE